MRQVSQDKAAIKLMAKKRFVVVAVVFFLITQSEVLRQDIQLCSDVGLQQVLALSPLSLHTAVSTSLKELPEG